MPEKENTTSLGQKSCGELENGSSPVGSCSETDGSRPAAEDRSVPKSGWKRIWYSVKVFLDSLDEEEEPEPPPPPEKPLKESVREFIECCRDREKRIVMLKAFGE